MSVTPDHPDEIVTKSLVRIVDLPGVSRPSRFALITLDNGHDHTRPNTFGPGGLVSLDAAITTATEAGVVGIGITGKPFVFSAGADVTGMTMIKTRDQALTIARAGHDVFRRLGELGIPTFAFVNGAALGGGLEVALHCTYRTIATSATAIGFPECFLGLVPAWGGAYLLPNLVGADRAVTVIIENALNQNRTLRGPEVLELGIADAMFEPADFIEQSLAWAAQVISGDVAIRRPEPDRGPAWDAAVARGRAFADMRLHGAAPAPYRALDLIDAARHRTRDEGFAAEDETIADLMVGPELRSSLYAFDLVQKRARRPAGAPPKELARPITKAGVVGAGLMASQLALLLVRRLEVPIVLTDLDQARIDKGVAYVHGELDKLQAKGRISADKAAKLKGLTTGSLDKGAFADADLVIEAVFEELKVKQQVFAELEAVVSDVCVLATNTSSLPVTQMAGDLRHPERVVGMHFFNPVSLMPLLEVIRAERTDEATLATALAVGKDLRKSCVLVKDAPGFVVNRLLTRMTGEVIKAADEGTPAEVVDHALDPLGLPATPFVLLQLVGPAVALHVTETMHEAYPDRFYVSDNLRRLVEAGKPSIYVWPEGRPVVDPEVTALFTVGTTVLTADQIRERALAALAEEIQIMLDDGIVAGPEDIDLCMILGAGWPFHLGGITPYLARTRVTRRE